MTIVPADRISDVKEYYFSRKLKEIDQMRQEGADILNLGIGNPDNPPAPEVLAELNQASSAPTNHGYQSYIGIPELRNAFSKWYKQYFDVELNSSNEILPLIGSKEGIMHISMAFINPGDEVLVPNPGYPTYMSVSKLVGATIKNYHLREEQNWQPDLEELEQTDLSKVKMMWINYPNMPTGAKADIRFLEKIVAFGKRNNIIIVNDNPYSFILNKEQTSILSIAGAKEICIELNSLSKSHNMAGWRIGIAASNPQFIQYILRVKSNMDSGMFRPLQMAATKALELPPSWYEEINKEYTERRKIVLEIMDLLKCAYDPEQVGMFIWAKTPENIKSSEELSEIILQKAHVFLTPGFIFGDAGLNYIRISLCTRTEMLIEAKNRIEKIKL